MNAVVARIAVALSLAALSVGLSHAGELILVVEGRVSHERSHAESGTALLTVERVFQISDLTLIPQSPLIATCPRKGDEVHTLAFKVGDSYSLEWEVKHKAKRGLGKRSKGGKATLKVPKDGWNIRCSGLVPKQLYGALVTDRGVASEKDMYGKRGGVLSIFGLTKGRAASAEDPVRMVFSWSPFDGAAAAQVGTSDWEFLNAEVEPEKPAEAESPS